MGRRKNVISWTIKTLPPFRGLTSFLLICFFLSIERKAQWKRAEQLLTFVMIETEEMKKGVESQIFFCYTSRMLMEHITAHIY